METLLVLVWKMRQEIDFQKTRVHVQALLSQKGAESDAIEKAFTDLRNAFFPYDKKDKKREISDMQAVLKREIAKGPMAITPTVDLTKANMKQKLAQGDRAVASAAMARKAGNVVSLDAHSARRKSR